MSSLLGREEDINHPHLFNGVNFSNMKINHRSRKSCMPESLLYLHYVLPVFQEMRCSTVPQVVYRDGMVESHSFERMLEDDAHIWRSDALWGSLASESLEDIVFAWILLSICLEHDEHLVGDGNVSVFCPLPLIDEEHLSVKADVIPSESACLADPERAVIDECKQGLGIQITFMQKFCHLLLREYSWQSLLLSDFGHAKSMWLLVAHDLVVSLESEDRVLEEGLAAPVPVEQHREITLDVVLCELLWQLLVVQHCLRDFQAIIIDAVVCILCETHLVSKKRNAVFEFRYSRNRLVQSCIGHINLWWRGLMTGGRKIPSSSSTF